MRREKKPVTLLQVFIAAAILLGIATIIIINMPDKDQASSESRGVYSIGTQAYGYTQQEQAGRHIVIFQPPLARDDTVVTGAIRELIKKTYKDQSVDNIQPQLVERAGVNVVAFISSNSKYYASLIKDSTGAVNSITYWRE